MRQLAREDASLNQGLMELPVGEYSRKRKVDSRLEGVDEAFEEI